MRTRYSVSLTFLVLFALFFAIRHHLRDLSEVVRTYSSFHTYLRDHQDVLLRFPTSLESPESASAVTVEQPAPKVIHQIFLSQGRANASLSKYEPAIASCQKLHPEWTFNMWHDDNSTAFIAEHYPDILPHYTGYQQNIQRANILRYALLHHFGGVYLDLDVTCRVALDAPVSLNGGAALTDLPWVTPGAYPAGVNNAFILSRPGHPFLAMLLSRVPSRDLSWPMPYVENMLSTGCMYFSNVWMSYALDRPATAMKARKENRMYILADENGEMEGHMLRGKIVTPLFEHGGASSWHGWDAAMIVMIGKHYGYVVMGLSAVVTTVGVLIWRLRRGKRNVGLRRRTSWRSALARLSLERRSEEGRGLMNEEEDLEKNG